MQYGVPFIHVAPFMPRIGLISDTHGLLRPEAITFLRGCEAIIHAGDVCNSSVLDEIARLAPVFAVRGNNDRGSWADVLPVARTLDFDGVRVHVVHDIADLAHEASPLDAAFVVHGHSHKPAIVARDGFTSINPGSAGPRRFTLPISIGELMLHADGRSATPRLVRLLT